MFFKSRDSPKLSASLNLSNTSKRKLKETKCRPKRIYLKNQDGGQRLIFLMNFLCVNFTVKLAHNSRCDIPITAEDISACIRCNLKSFGMRLHELEFKPIFFKPWLNGLKAATPLPADGFITDVRCTYNWPFLC